MDECMPRERDGAVAGWASIGALVISMLLGWGALDAAGQDVGPDSVAQDVAVTPADSAALGVVQDESLAQRLRAVFGNIEDFDDVQVQVRSYHAVPSDGGAGHEFYSTADVMADEAKRDAVFAACKRELAAVRDKYEALVDVQRAWREISRAGEVEPVGVR